MKKIISVSVLEDYRVWLRFDDGVEGIADLSELVGRGVFAAWRDYAFFRRAFVADYGSPTWPGELDLCPDALWLQITRKQPEDLFPNLKALADHGLYDGSCRLMSCPAPDSNDSVSQTADAKNSRFGENTGSI